MDKLLREYIEASGAVALCVVASDGRVEIKRASTKDLNGSRIFWLANHDAIAVARRARQSPQAELDEQSAQDALHKAAAALGVTLTPHNLLISRARLMANALDERLRNGMVLREFNTAYRLRREAASTRGEGFMTYGTALARLRRLVIVKLCQGMQASVTTGMFDEVFNAASSRAEITR